MHLGRCDGRASEGPYKSGITLLEALRLLAIDAERFVRDVNRYVTVPLNQNQFDALVSFAFNLGGDTLRTATFVGRLNRGDYSAVRPGLMLYVNSGGVPMAGLVRRRREEADLFETPVTPVEDATGMSSLEFKQLDRRLDGTNNLLAMVGAVVNDTAEAVEQQGNINKVLISSLVSHHKNKEMHSAGIVPDGGGDAASAEVVQAVIDEILKRLAVDKEALVEAGKGIIGAEMEANAEG